MKCFLLLRLARRKALPYRDRQKQIDYFVEQKKTTKANKPEERAKLDTETNHRP